MTASLNNDNANAMSPLNSSSEPPVPGISIQKNEEEQGNSNAADTSSTISTALPTPSTKASSHTNVSEPISYTLPKCELPPMSELEPVEKFVINAIQSQHEENPNPAHVKGYRALADALRRPSDPVMLRNVLIALRTAGSGRALTLITGDPIKHAHLTHLIMRFLSTKPPKGFEDNLPEGVDAEFFFKVYEDCSMLDAQMHLILAMVSAKSINLIPALTAVWKMLAMFPSNPEPVVFRLHAMLFTMMRLCPKTRTEMFPIIASKFPFWTNSAPILTFYIVQAFRVMDYLPSIRRNLLEIVIDKCLEMDVNIKIKGNGEVSIEEGKSENEQDEVEETPTDETEKETSVDEAVDKLSDKLDSCLAVLFETIKRGCKDFTSVRELYYDILPVFESTILTTHKSKFVQYCMFLLCCLESQLLSDEERLMKITSPGQQPNDHAILHRDFAAKLIDIIVDPYRATMTRQSGACYLASFISRSSYVGPETLCESVSALLRWAEAYIDSVVAVRAADSREQSELHSLFYTVCQAAFYIMSFRGPEAIKFYREVSAGYTAGTESPDDNEAFFMPDPEHIDMGSKRWTTICSHNLQPLRFCLESVRSEFLHIAHAYDLIDEQVLDKLVADAKHLSTGRVNKKAAFKISTAATLEKQRETGGVGGLGRGSNPLKSFFPFDPLLLRRSHDYIEKYYTHWQGSCEEEDVLVIDDGSEGEEDPIFEMDENMESNEASDDEADGEDDEDGLPVVVSDQETREDNEYDMDESMRTPDAQVKKENQRRAWTETLKRPRSLSIENGSW